MVVRIGKRHRGRERAQDSAEEVLVATMQRRGGRAVGGAGGYPPECGAEEEVAADGGEKGVEKGG
jgi:hypothetical protein